MNIAIIGGGTAGWLAAMILSKSADHSITLVESSKLGIIGVGEGGTHVIGSLINNNSEFDARNFMESTEGSMKIAVEHAGWPNNYHMPLDILPNTDREDFLPLLISQNKNIHEVSELGLFLSEKKVPIKKDESGVWTETDWSFHFDGHLVGEWLKSKSQNVKVIDNIVQDIILDETGINKLILENQITISADLYIDCTGFKRLLMNALGNKWISYKDHLIVNSAIPFRLTYQDFHDINIETRASAMNAGWTWRIPLDKKIGLGYVYCDKFINYEDALKELEFKFPQTTINPVKHLKFEAGRLNNMWYKNCVSLGLASAFVEPLEATSVHATKIQIDALYQALEGNMSKETYNKDMAKIYEDIRDFIILHYLGGRTDTEFWKYCSSEVIATDRVREILDITKYRLLTEDDISNPYNHLSYRAWNQVLAGIGKISKEVAEKSITNGMFERYQLWKEKSLLKIKDYKSLQDAMQNGDWTM